MIPSGLGTSTWDSRLRIDTHSVSAAVQEHAEIIRYTHCWKQGVRRYEYVARLALQSTTVTALKLGERYQLQDRLWSSQMENFPKSRLCGPSFRNI